MEALNENGRKFFTAARDFSAQFYSIVGRQGYLAWDISERMVHLRNGYACGLPGREKSDELAEAQAFGISFCGNCGCGPEQGICVGFRDKRFLGIHRQDWTL